MPHPTPGSLPPVKLVTTIIAGIPSRIEKCWTSAIQVGWYPTAESDIAFDLQLLAKPSELDAYMMNQLQRKWEKLTDQLVSEYHARRHILECAFELHQSSNFIASVPLFLAQADGIVAERLGSHFFTDHEARDDKLLKKAAQENNLSASLLKLLIPRTQFQAGISKHSPKKKELAPNRSGVLHGARQHLDYGTQMNSFKCFSLLAYVAFILRQAKQ